MADSVVVANNVELVANNIQSKVGATLLGTKAVVEDTVGESKPPIEVLEQIKTLTTQTVEKATAIWEILKSQLDFEKDEARKAREQHNELMRERGGKKGIKGGTLGGLEEVTDKASGAFGQRFMDMAMGAGATMFTMTFLKKMVGRIFRAGFFLLLADYAGDALIASLDVESESSKEAIKTVLPTAAVLFGLLKFGTAIKLIIPALVLQSLWSLKDWIMGKEVAAEISGFKWGTVALLPAAVASTSLLFGGVKGATTLLALLGGWPVVIAASIAIVLAAGIGYLNSKISEVQQKMLDHLGEINKMTQAQFDKEMAESKADFKSKIIGAELYTKFGGKATLPQEIEMATSGALELAKLKDPKKFTKEKQDVVIENMEKMKMFLNTMDEDLIIEDSYKIKQIQKSLDNVYKIALTGGLGARGDSVMAQVEEMRNHLQGLAQKIVDERPEEATNFVIDVSKNRGGDYDQLQEALRIETLVQKYADDKARFQKKKNELLAIPKKDRPEDWSKQLVKTNMGLNIATENWERWSSTFNRTHKDTLDSFKAVVQDQAIEDKILSLADKDIMMKPILTKKKVLLEDKPDDYKDKIMNWENKQLLENKKIVNLTTFHGPHMINDPDLQAALAQTK